MGYSPWGHAELDTNEVTKQQHAFNIWVIWILKAICCCAFVFLFAKGIYNDNIVVFPYGGGVVGSRNCQRYQNLRMLMFYGQPTVS